MTWSNLKPVAYSQEYGDPTLPKLSELVSDTPDPYKDIILDYLNEHCIAASPGIHYDVIDPSKSIGCRNIYRDDKYYWTDCFANYVRRYNIPVPSEFRAHILKNYTARKLQHTRHRLVKRIAITHALADNQLFYVSIDIYGTVQYRDSSMHSPNRNFTIDSSVADYIVHPVTKTLFYYDSPRSYSQEKDGYYWSIDFYNAKGHARKIEGCTGEPKERAAHIRRLLELVERETGINLGSIYMRNC